MGALLAYIYVHKISHESRGTKYSYLQFGFGYIATVLLGVALVSIDDPYGDALPAVLGKVATALASIYVTFRVLRRRYGI